MTGTVSQVPDDRLGFHYQHVVSFEETNLVGNVYFVRHVAWQGRCREMFLRTHAPSILDELSRDLRLVTLRVSCDYFTELQAFDEIDIRMTLAHVRQHRIGLAFEYVLQRGSEKIVAAIGSQEVGCMTVASGHLTPIAVPPALARAFTAYSA